MAILHPLCTPLPDNFFYNNKKGSLKRVLTEDGLKKKRIAKINTVEAGSYISHNVTNGVSLKNFPVWSTPKSFESPVCSTGLFVTNV